MPADVDALERRRLDRLREDWDRRRRGLPPLEEDLPEPGGPPGMRSRSGARDDGQENTH
jgi:hypothetical protein